MGVVEFLLPRALAVQEKLYRWIAIGFLIYIGSAFVLDGSQQKTFFYLLVALPALFLFCRSSALFRAEPWSMASVLLFFGYYSLSALWSGGDGSIMDALKYSLYIFCLMLAIEATMQRFSPEFLAGFIAVIGGVAACAYMVTIALGDTPLSSLMSGRFALHALGGWGADNPITSAVIFGLPVIAAWWLFPNQRLYIQLALAMLMLMSLALMFISKSRGPFLALGATLLMLALFRRSKYDLLLIVGGCAFLGIFAWLSNIDTVVAQRAVAPNYRLDIWMQVLEQFRDNWLVGQGFGNDARISIGSGQLVTHSHSSLFEVFRVGGVIGGSLFLLMLGLLVGRSFTRTIGFFFLLWLIYGAICLASNGRLLLSRPSVEWFAFWLPLFLLYFSTRPRALRRAQST